MTEKCQCAIVIDTQSRGRYLDVKRKEFVSALIMLCCMFAFSSCSENVADGRSAVVIEEVSSSQSMENEVGAQTEAFDSDLERSDAAEAETQGSIDAHEAENFVLSEEHGEQEFYEFQSMEKFFRQTDENWNESAEYQEAVKAYGQAIRYDTVEWIKENLHYGYGNARFQVGYIDEDDIPELLLCYDTVHVDGVHVFTYLPKTGEVVRVGEFSSFGGIRYSHKKNRILSQYGNQGFYVQYVSSIENGKPKLVDVAISAESTKYVGVVGYYGFSVMEGIDGSRDAFRKLDVSSFIIPDDYEDYLISDEEEEIIIEKLMENTDIDEQIWVNYYDMHTVFLKI